MATEHTVYVWSDRTTAGANVAIPSLNEQFYIDDARRALAEAARRLGIAVEQVEVKHEPPPAEG